MLLASLGKALFLAFILCGNTKVAASFKSSILRYVLLSSAAIDFAVSIKIISALFPKQLASSINLIAIFIICSLTFIFLNFSLAEKIFSLKSSSSSEYFSENSIGFFSNSNLFFIIFILSKISFEPSAFTYSPNLSKSPALKSPSSGFIVPIKINLQS